MQIGDPDGFGDYGCLSVVDDGERLVCHECGQTHRALSTHTRRAHALPADEYRTRHGLPPDTPLIAPATRRRPARSRASGIASHPTA